MPIVKVDAPEQASAYDIHIGHGLLKKGTGLLERCRGHRAMIVTDENVAPLYLDAMKAQLEAAGAQASAFVLPAGETTKCMAQLERIYDALIDARITRQDFVVALGGGVVGDIAGYAACTYLRGVHFIQAPTTLLAQVDSSVGGKVAVNHPRGKNLLGAFYQPELVMIDCDTLKTLDARQIGAGLGEVIKYGCIGSSSVFPRASAAIITARCDADLLGRTRSSPCRSPGVTVLFIHSAPFFFESLAGTRTSRPHTLTKALQAAPRGSPRRCMRRFSSAARSARRRPPPSYPAPSPPPDAPASGARPARSAGHMP